MGDQLNYWEGKAVFKPTNASIDVFVDGSANDNMGRQHDVFAQLMNEWPKFGPAIDRVLLERLHDREPSISAESAWSMFRISSLSVPNDSVADASWEISFTKISDPTHLWTAQMRGFSPEGLTIDD